MLEPFTGKFSFFFFLSGYPTVCVSISHSLPWIVLRAFRPSPYPEHAARISLSSLWSLVSDPSIWATSLLEVAVRRMFCVFVFPPGYVTLRFQNSPQTGQWEDFLLFVNFSSFRTPSPGWVSVTNFFVSLFFCLSYFVLPPFKENGLPFWVPGVLCQGSEVLLWNLLSIQMIFWWIFGGGLPVLFLCHLRTTP